MECSMKLQWVADAQVRYAGEVEEVAIGDNLMASLNRAAVGAREAGVLFESVLELVITQAMA